MCYVFLYVFGLCVWVMCLGHMLCACLLVRECVCACVYVYVQFSNRPLGLGSMSMCACAVF